MNYNKERFVLFWLKILQGKRENVPHFFADWPKIKRSVNDNTPGFFEVSMQESKKESEKQTIQGYIWGKVLVGTEIFVFLVV